MKISGGGTSGAGASELRALLVPSFPFPFPILLSLSWATGYTPVVSPLLPCCFPVVSPLFPDGGGGYIDSTSASLPVIL